MTTGYKIQTELLHETYSHFEPLYRKHYEAMRDRLNGDGIHYAEYNPRLASYFKASREGYLLHFTARAPDGSPAGYCNIWLTNDMHNGELIAKEDMIFVLPEHRNGIGRLLAHYCLDELRRRSVRRLLVSAMVDLRAVKLWKRMGFQELATQMVYNF